jgi:DNA-binding CsgD family transcriptional regulator
MNVVRRSGRPLLVLVAPVKATHAAWQGAPTTLVLIQDPDAEPAGPSDHLAALFGFSAAECRIAEAMLGGDSLEVIADRLHLSLHTVRSHVQRLFAKTGTQRQADLLRVLLAAIPPIDPR